eukprot:COSAG01_NODE_18193_length_1094_cov_1.387940_1_plen_99_part_00
MLLATRRLPRLHPSLTEMFTSLMSTYDTRALVLGWVLSCRAAHLSADCVCCLRAAGGSFLLREGAPAGDCMYVVESGELAAHSKQQVMAPAALSVSVR